MPSDHLSPCLCQELQLPHSRGRRETLRGRQAWTHLSSTRCCPHAGCLAALELITGPAHWELHKEGIVGLVEGADHAIPITEVSTAGVRSLFPPHMYMSLCQSWGQRLLPVV